MLEINAVKFCRLAIQCSTIWRNAVSVVAERVATVNGHEAVSECGRCQTKKGGYRYEE